MPLHDFETAGLIRLEMKEARKARQKAADEKKAAEEAEKVRHARTIREELLHGRLAALQR